MSDRKTRWVRALLEGLVIVGSILLAFGIDAWWEGRSEAQAEQKPTSRETETRRCRW